MSKQTKIPNTFYTVKKSESYFVRMLYAMGHFNQIGHTKIDRNDTFLTSQDWNVWSKRQVTFGIFTRSKKDARRPSAWNSVKYIKRNNWYQTELYANNNNNNSGSTDDDNNNTHQKTGKNLNLNRGGVKVAMCVWSKIDAQSSLWLGIHMNSSTALLASSCRNLPLCW